MQYLIIVLLLVCGLAFAQSNPGSLTSPDGGIQARFLTVRSNQPASNGQLVYAVAFKGKPLATESALRLDLKGQPLLGSNVRIVGSSSSTTDETYRLVTGKTSLVRNHYNALRIELEEVSERGRKMSIEARAYDDAIAFRYVVPEQPSLSEFQLAKELTEFRISKDATSYALVLPHYKSMYESEFVKLPISAFSNQGGVASTVLIGLPLLMDVPGVGWLAIAEADLRDYSAMYLVNPSGSWTGHWLESRLAPHVDDPETSVAGSLPHHSAWRVLLIASEPGKLIESTVLTSLNPEPEIRDTSWIRSGKASWDWWNGSLGRDGKSAYNTDTMKYYVDFAAKSGFEYMLIDAGWFPQGDITRMNGRVDIPEVVRYATVKQVKIWIWLGYRETVKQMEEAFALYEKWGVAGLKIDFIERDDQEGMAFYYRAAETAAKHHLMVDFHGCTKPSGMDRTWPNVMGYEAVLGMEQSKAGTRDNPDNHVTLPFTRMLAGRMDYTPGGFNNVTRNEFEPRMRRPMVTGTRAHHLAMYVVYESPFQMVSDYPGAYENDPSFEFIRSVPASWDETRVLNGMPGEYITIARRRGDEWFLGCMGNWSARKLEFPLTFLGNGRYEAEIYSDPADADRFPKKVMTAHKRVDKGTRLKVELAPGGGYTARLRPVR